MPVPIGDVLPPIIFRKGLDLKAAVAASSRRPVHRTSSTEIALPGYVRRTGRLTIHLAKEFGFCYGVDRAVDYAYRRARDSPIGASS